MGKHGAKQNVQIDWMIVKKLAAMQSTGEEIAHFLEISLDYLEKACKKTYNQTLGAKLKHWQVGGHCSLRRKQWLLADKNASMAIFLGKNILGQKDSAQMNHSGSVVTLVQNYGDKPLAPYVNDTMMPNDS